MNHTYVCESTWGSRVRRKVCHPVRNPRSLLMGFDSKHFVGGEIVTTTSEAVDSTALRLPSHSVSERRRWDLERERVLLTRVGLHMPDQLRFEDWERAGKRLSSIVDSSSWCLGDWLVYGKQHYSDRYKKAIKSAGLQYQTLRNYAWVSGRFEMNRRRPLLTFQHHAEVASLPLPDQDSWLDRAQREMWTTKQLRMQIRRERLIGTGQEDDSAVIPRIEVPERRLALWRRAADQSGMEFESWVMATLDGAAEQTLGDDPVNDEEPPRSSPLAV